MIKVWVCALFLAVTSLTTTALPRNKKTEVYLGNGRWMPIVGSNTPTTKFRNHDELSTTESRRIRLITKVPKLVVHNLHPHHPEIKYDPMPYKFGYDFKDDGKHHNYGGSQQYRHEEGGINGSKRGSYGYRDARGIYRHVDYVADEYGFRATIRTNEPGTSHQNSAAVDIHVDKSSQIINHPLPREIKPRYPTYDPILPIYHSNRSRKPLTSIKRNDITGTLPSLYKDEGVPQASIWYPMFAFPN